MTALVRAGGAAALVAGAGRMLAGLWPLEVGTMLAEAVYGLIDFGFLLGLAALYLFTEDRLKAWGRLPFLVAAAGAAILTGPDGSVAGISGFVLGAGLILAGTASLGALFLWRDRRFVLSAALWLAAPAIAAAGTTDLAAILLGAGFAAAGARILLSAPASSSRAQPAGRS